MSDQNAPSHVVILGLMGVGKTTIGESLADALGWPFSDSDTEIESLTGVPGRVIAQRSGVRVLHIIESAVLLGALERSANHVISAAASVVENEIVMEALAKNSFVVRLQASLATTLARQSHGDHRRPMSESELDELAVRREPLFAAVEDIVLDADQPIDTLVHAIMGAYRSKGLT